MVMKPNIALHIDELILSGFPPGDRYLICDAIQNELTIMLAERGLPSPMALGRDYPALDAGQLRLGPQSDAKTAGRQIARTLFQGFQSMGTGNEGR